MHKSELPLNVINYYKIEVISEIFLIILEFPKKEIWTPNYYLKYDEMK
jgi:hypothetical protein